MLPKVLRQPNEIFCRADSMRDPYMEPGGARPRRWAKHGFVGSEMVDDAARRRMRARHGLARAHGPLYTRAGGAVGSGRAQRDLTMAELGGCGLATTTAPTRSRTTVAVLAMPRSA